MKFLGGKELLKFKLASTPLAGFFPIHKPKNICCNKLLKVVRADIDYVLRTYELKRSAVAINYARYLEPFASGIVTFALGDGNYNKRNFVFAEQKYRALIEFGIQRQFDCRDGEIISLSSFDHIDLELLNSQLSHFIGELEQDRGPVPLESSYKFDSTSMKVEDYYSKIEIFNPKGEKLSPDQKFPLERPRKQSSTTSIKLIEFQKPLALVEISCRGNFSPRQFVNDLASRMHTKASILELCRLEEGPVSIEDSRIFHLHEVNLEYYVHWLSYFNKVYDDYLSKFEHNFQTDPTYRPI